MAKRKYKKQAQKTKIIYLLLGVLLTLLVLGVYFLLQGDLSLDKVYETLGLNKPNVVTTLEGELNVHFIDVGQGDSILIEAPDQTVLIDGGDNDQADKLLRYLKKQKVSKIDLVIASHPDADHIGGLDKVIDSFEVKQVMMPKLPDSIVKTTKSYEDLLMAIKNKGLTIKVPEAGQQYSFKGGKMVFVGPVKKDYKEVNNHSISLRLEYGKQSFLFMGDTEKKAEKDILQTNSKLNAVVLKASHHGSNGASGTEFLEAVNPDYVVFSCGASNKYGHPGKQTVERVKSRKAKILRTDLHGSVVFQTDGNELTVTKEKG